MRSLAVAALVLVAGAGCGDDGAPSASADGGFPNEGGVTLPAVSKVVGPEGGDVALGEVTLSIPGGTLTTPQTITIQATDERPPDGYGASSRVYHFGPDGLVFARPVTITFDNQINPSRVIYWTDPQDGGRYRRRPTTTDGAKVSASVSHFSSGFVGFGVGTVEKVDLLFAIDNSASMGDKQAILSQAVPDLIDRLLHPRCLGPDGKSLGTVTDDQGRCADGKPEFPAVYDMHIGIVSSSLGAVGGDYCAAAATNDHGRLLNRNSGGTAVPDALPSNFLAWLPPRDKNAGKPAPAVPPITDANVLKKDFSDLMTGAGEGGCGFEGQLESMYRFLVQPDPYDHIQRDADANKFVGIDDVILRQRRDFLRPDSLVAVIMLTDENESTIDPMAFGGRAYRFTSQAHLMSGTAACATNPNSPACTSCFLAAANGDPGCHQLSDEEDAVNVRFFHMKQRFGVDPRYPIDRYVRGFTERMVPDREGEHPGQAAGAPSVDYQGTPNCQNPLFAATLPGSSSDELCRLPSGPRTRDLVHFAVVGGVPWQLLTEEPQNLTKDNRAPFKAFLNDADWLRILGANPFAYDFTGQDLHMRESMDKRALGADDVHQREWDTLHKDLQFACVFPLPQPRDCTKPENQLACDCAAATDAPLCAPNPSAGSSTWQNSLQVRGKAYPTLSSLAVAKGLGIQAFVGSICPRELTDKNSEYYGYRPAIAGIVSRLSLAFE